jgi:hypothetical protein
MAKPVEYHINDEGVAGPCRAKIKCQFNRAGNHFPTLKAAQEEAERRNAQMYSGHSKPAVRSATEIIDVADLRVAKSVRGIKTGGKKTFLTVSEVDVIDTPKITDEPAVDKLIRDNGLPFG